MTNLTDLTGKTFSRLTVISLFTKGTKDKPSKWECVCSCGNTSVAYGKDLKSGNTKSCGCLRNELISSLNASHKRSKTPEYISWCLLIARCTNPKNKRFGRYGGRGIMVCYRWRNSFENFFKDMGEKPSAKHTINRINNDKGYYKENCEWVTPQVNSQNRSTSIGDKKVLEIKNKLNTGIKVAALSNEYKLAVSTIYRIKKGQIYSNITIANTPSEPV